MPWKFDLTDRVHTIEGTRVRIENQLTEVTFEPMGQRHVLCLAREKKENEEPGDEFMLKIRYDLNPATLGGYGLLYTRDEMYENFIEEIFILQIVHRIGHAPKYIDHDRLLSNRYPYPDGIVDMYLMRRVPGEVVTKIFTELSDEQLASIKKQLAYLLEEMRQYGRVLREQHPNFLRYDIENDRLYLVDFTFFSFCNPDTTEPITEDSMYVLAFNIWQRHLPRTFAETEEIEESDEEGESEEEEESEEEDEEFAESDEESSTSGDDDQ